MADQALRLSAAMRSALVLERDGRLPELDAALKSKDKTERRGAERTRMALVARGFLAAMPFRCELTEAGLARVAQAREAQYRKAFREAQAKALMKPTAPWSGKASKVSLRAPWA